MRAFFDRHGCLLWSLGFGLWVAAMVAWFAVGNATVGRALFIPAMVLLAGANWRPGRDDKELRRAWGEGAWWAFCVFMVAQTLRELIHGGG